MKRVVFSLIILMLSCGAIVAQIDSTSVKETVSKIGTNTSSQEKKEQPAPKYEKSQWFTIGAKAAYNISLTQDKITDLYTLHTGLRQGGSMGMYLRLGTNVFCQPEVVYTFSLYDSKRVIAGDSLSQDLQNHTIDLPVLLGYSPICSETFKFRLLIGPRFAFNVNKNEKYNPVKPDRDDMTVSMSKARLGLDCGIGFDFWKISLDIRYILMQDIYKYQYLNHETGEWRRVNFPISTFQIAIGYNIWGNNMPSSKKLKYDPSAYDFFKKTKD